MIGLVKSREIQPSYEDVIPDQESVVSALDQFAHRNSHQNWKTVKHLLMTHSCVRKQSMESAVLKDFI